MQSNTEGVSSSGDPAANLLLAVSFALTQPSAGDGPLAAPYRSLGLPPVTPYTVAICSAVLVASASRDLLRTGDRVCPMRLPGFCLKPYLSALLTPIMVFSSVMVTCRARSTAAATWPWCSCDRNGRICPMIAFNRLAISV